MKKALILSFIFISVSAVCQTNIVSKTPLIDTTFSVKLTGSFFIERKQFVGQQYYNQDWATGDILLNTGEKLMGISLKYNGLYDDLIWLNTFNYGIFKLDKPTIKEFWLKTGNGLVHHFKQLKINIIQDSIKNVFAEILMDKTVSFFVQRKIEVQGLQYVTVNKIRQKYDNLVVSPVYYFKLPSNQYVSIERPNRKKVLNIFPENKKDIAKIITDNHLNLKRESDLVRLVELMNENQLFSK